MGRLRGAAVAAMVLVAPGTVSSAGADDALSDLTLEELMDVRGTNGNGNDKIVVLRDGIRIDAVGASPIALGHNFTLAGAERVEVVIGPASAVYGPDAFTAVVHIISADQVSGGTLSAGLGRFRTGEGSLVAGDVIRGVALTLTAAGYHSDAPDLSSAYPEDFAWYHDRYQTDGEVLEFPGAPPDQVVTVPNWLDVHNLLDNRYHLPSNAFDHLSGVPQDPLRIMVGVDLTLE